MKNITLWILQIVCSVILLQTLFFKFSAHPESVALFTQLGMEPHGRILIGVLELIAGITLLIPSTAAYGAVLTSGLMTGALIGHATKLGFSGPMLSLSIMAALVLIFSISIMIIRRKELFFMKNMLP